MSLQWPESCLPWRTATGCDWRASFACRRQPFRGKSSWIWVQRPHGSFHWSAAEWDILWWVPKNLIRPGPVVLAVGLELLVAWIFSQWFGLVFWDERHFELSWFPKKWGYRQIIQVMIETKNWYWNPCFLQIPYPFLGTCQTLQVIRDSFYRADMSLSLARKQDECVPKGAQSFGWKYVIRLDMFFPHVFFPHYSSCESLPGMMIESYPACFLGYSVGTHIQYLRTSQ